jgi:EAL domain-containing protein (putative c-di-GMP-specific phosphodiesterase class I)
MALPSLDPVFGSVDPKSFRPGVVELILKAVREHLGMDVAFASRVANGKVVIQYADTGESALVEAGQVFDAEESYCQRVLDGRLPFVIPDASALPEAARLEATRTMPIRAHVSIPLRLSDGSIYGTFCCFRHTPEPSLNERDLNTMQAFAEIAATQIEAKIAHDDLREALAEKIGDIVKRGTVTMAMQPICRLSDGGIVGFEALARFPDRKERPPSAWFEEAKQVGLGGALELAAVRSTLAALPYLAGDYYLAVNVSPETVLDPELSAILDELGDRRVVVEVTEHAIINDYDALKHALDELRGKVRIAVDDAGAGYSGLRHIIDLKPDLIKLDISLTRDIDRDPARAAMTAALVRFAREIGSLIVAEGVETAAEYAALRRLKVDAAQGHYLYRPMPLAAAAQLIGGSGKAA